MLLGEFPIDPLLPRLRASLVPGATVLLQSPPGAGKTMAACIIAADLIAKELIDRVIVVAPRSEVINQWAKEFRTCTGRYMGKVTGSDDDFEYIDYDLCATWAAVQGLSAGFQ